MSDPLDPNKVVILDRDGTLVIDKHYLADPADLEFTPRAPEALELLTEHAYRLIVITNQSGIGRGLFSIEDLKRMNRRLHAMVEETGAHLTQIYFCPHSPSDDCDCRKPKLGLLAQAVFDHRFDPRQAVVIGDRDSDMEFAKRASARAILICSQSHPQMRDNLSYASATNLMEAALIVTSGTDNHPDYKPLSASESRQIRMTESSLDAPKREFLR